MPLYQYVLKRIISKNKDILLHIHSNIIKMSKFHFDTKFIIDHYLVLGPGIQSRT